MPTSAVPTLAAIAASIKQSAAGMGQWSMAELTIGLYKLANKHALEGAADTIEAAPVTSRYLPPIFKLEARPNVPWKTDIARQDEFVPFFSQSKRARRFFLQLADFYSFALLIHSNTNANLFPYRAELTELLHWLRWAMAAYEFEVPVLASNLGVSHPSMLASLLPKKAKGQKSFHAPRFSSKSDPKKR